MSHAHVDLGYEAHRPLFRSGLGLLQTAFDFENQQDLNNRIAYLFGYIGLTKSYFPGPHAIPVG
eukprot:CAMPEP_0204344684 /NCGR_PEP_ID=MMETSP0469-20131031/25807_1 /ASSEMBLY_ACC=CAM_ASM_000384 /TAXON_ID=2969 /ORGANISM="Oxyrrhis marina" /LENGTH=63 /DNA_ID=CAMNT_0051329971 /DNA_START=26 /DNA_END=214 /DNA_ORIENTATION=+